MTDIPDLPRDEIDTLLSIMRALRDPETGCPWDIKQNFASIAPYTIEEAYEVSDAIARGDMDDLRDELGDLLLQVIYHSQMASESGAFGLADVIRSINDKMIRRHPHVFGDEGERGKAPKPGFWEKIKDKERKGGEQGVLDGIPTALPALTLSEKLQARAARVNFDWPDTSFVYDKLAEELEEFRAEEKSGDQARMTAELGDILFVLANLARHNGIDPEMALRATCDKFKRRFSYMEKTIAKNNENMNDKTLNELDALWDEAKALENR